MITGESITEIQNVKRNIYLSVKLINDKISNLVGSVLY